MKCFLRIMPRNLDSRSFIDDSTTSLPAVDILLLSRVALSRCTITLSSAPFSLLITTASNISRGCWRPVRDIRRKKSFWTVPHSQVGCGTTALFKLYSLSRISYFELPSLFSFLIFHRVMLVEWWMK